MDTGIDIDHIFRLASHLYYWKIGIIIQVPMNYYYYILNDINQYKIMEYNQLYNKKFPDFFTFIDLLKMFSIEQPLQYHLKKINISSHNKFITILLWLLSNNLIQRLSTRIIYIGNEITHTTNHQLKKVSNSNLINNTSFSIESPLLHSNITNNINEVSKLSLSSSYIDADLQNIEKIILPIFDGKHDISQIIYHENVSIEEIYDIVESSKNYIMYNITQKIVVI